MRCSSNDPFRLRSFTSRLRLVLRYLFTARCIFLSKTRAARRAAPTFCPHRGLYRYTAIVTQHRYNIIRSTNFDRSIDRSTRRHQHRATRRFSILLCPFIGPSDKQDNKDRYVRMVRIGFIHLSRSRLEKRTFFRVSRVFPALSCGIRKISFFRTFGDTRANLRFLRNVRTESKRDARTRAQPVYIAYISRIYRVYIAI